MRHLVRSRPMGPNGVMCRAGTSCVRRSVVSRHWIAEPSATAREVKGPFIMGSRTSGTSAVRHDWKRERKREFKETQRGEVID